MVGGERVQPKMTWKIQEVKETEQIGPKKENAIDRPK